MKTFRSPLAPLIVAVLFFVGCSSDEAGLGRPPSGAEAPTSQPPAQPTTTGTSPAATASPVATPVSQMTVVPDPAPPGAVLELWFPEGALRGVGFELQRAVNGEWERTHWMISDGNDPNEMDTFPAIDDGLGTIDVGFEEAGAERVVLPEDVADGRYRVCAWNIHEERCAEFEIGG